MKSVLFGDGFDVGSSWASWAFCDLEFHFFADFQAVLSLDVGVVNEHVFAVFGGYEAVAASVHPSLHGSSYQVITSLSWLRPRCE